MLPSKKSKSWFLTYVIFAILVFIVLNITRIILGNFALDSTLFRFALLSLLIAVPILISGYFFKRIFLLIYTLSVVIGIIYAFYIVIGDVSPGWGDLTSMIGFLFIIVIGLFTGIIVETIYYLVSLSRRS